jgi:hypothetical protein
MIHMTDKQAMVLLKIGYSWSSIHTFSIAQASDLIGRLAVNDWKPVPIFQPNGEEVWPAAATQPPAEKKQPQRWRREAVKAAGNICMACGNKKRRSELLAFSLSVEQAAVICRECHTKSLWMVCHLALTPGAA